MRTQIIKQIKNAPKNPGVYIFYKNKAPLYVGKASDLKGRLQNYLKVTDLKTRALNKEATKLKLIKLHSNIEALIIESQLIKKLKPRYNVLWRDDASYFYVYFTRETFPRIYIGHRFPKRIKNKELRIKHSSLFKIHNSDQIGPFTDGQSLKAILRLLRRYFPYCTCKPHFRLCLNAQINNCPGYCCNKNIQPTKKQIAVYKRSVQRIKNILTGKDTKFIKKLKDPYELLILEKIWQHKDYLENKILDSRFYILDSETVECYDVSHLSGKEAAGAMTAWRKINNKWVADKNMWRQFKIKGSYTEDDPRMMEEIVSRRLNHPEWTYPELMIIDGGITQLKAAQRALKTLRPKPSSLNPKIISFAKPQKLIFGLEKKPVSILNLPKEWQALIEIAINQTHNFVQRFHRRIRQKRFMGYN